MRSGRTRAFSVLFLAGALLWLAGALALYPEALLSVGALLCGGFQMVTAAFLMRTGPRSVQRAPGAVESMVFCVTLGLGWAAIGFALSPLTRWLDPALIVGLCGLGLIAWSPQALRGREPGN